MKTRLLTILTGILVGTGMMMLTFDGESNSVPNNAYGMWRPLSPEALMEESKTVFVGTITAVTPVDVEYQSQTARDGANKNGVGPEVMTLEEYTVSVDEYLKNIQDLDTLKVLSATVGGVPGGPSRINGFEIGDRVLFYLPKDENQTHFANQYLPESFKIPKQCDAKSVLEQPKIAGANDFKIMQDGIPLNDNFTANKPLKFVYNRDMRTLEGKNFDVDISISKINGNDKEIVIKENIHTESKPCEWISTASWEFVPTAGEYSMLMHTSQDNSTGGETSGRNFMVIENMSEPLISTNISESQFEEIKSNIEKTEYDVCDIRLEDNKIVIDLHKFFEGSEPENKIISKIPSNVDYEIFYYDGYSDYFINTITAHTCDYLENTDSLRNKNSTGTHIEVNYENFRYASDEPICKGSSSGSGFLAYPECGPIDQFVIHVLVLVLPAMGIVSGFIIWRKRKCQNQHE
jgi:hypothetical protein